jgi:hypothetical protein
MKINKYFPFAFIYFFINSLALPIGLTYTAILSPLFYWWVIRSRKKEILLPFFVCLAPFLIIHFILAVDTKTYIISIVNYTAVYIFCQAFYTFIKVCEQPEKIFRKLLILNFAFCLIAILVYFTSYDRLLWMEHTITDGLDNFKRLKLFTYEASYYAALFTPLFFFYLLQIILHRNKINSWLLLPMLLLPYMLSFSIGVTGSVLVAILLTYCVYFRTLTRKKRVVSLLILGGGVSLSVFVALLIFFPQNSLFIRAGNIFSGNDTSGKGRTSEAFMLAWQILEQKSFAWGVGPGQIKLLGADIIRSFYLYDLDYNTIAIPNAAAETLAIFGWAGLLLRILVELFLFFYTRVWKNYYRLLLFLFIFLYQFTGSFITNIAEYVIWILAFTNTFPGFDVRNNRPAFIHIHQNITG